MKNVRLAFVAVLAMSFVAAGCGSDDKKDSSTSTAAPASTTASTAADPTATTAAPTNVDAAAKAAIEACKASIDAQPTLKDDLKADLKGVCDKAASGDAKAVAAATKEVCTKIVEASVPDGDVRKQALAACDSTTQAP